MTARTGLRLSTTRALWWAAPFIVAIVVSLGGTWPLLLHLDSWPGILSDQPLYVWAFDTQVRRILAGQWPLWTDRILFPFGINLLSAWNSGPILGVLAIPFLGHLPAYINLLAFLSLGGAVLTTVLLVVETGGSLTAGMLLGMLYAFGPVRDAVWRSHVLSAITAMLAPLTVWAIVRLAREPTWRRAVWATLAVWVVASTYPYYGIVTVLVASGALLAHPSRRLFGWVGGLAGVHVVALWMILWRWDATAMGSFADIGNADVGDVTGAFWYPGVVACVVLALGGCLRWDGVVYAQGLFPWVWLGEHNVFWGTLDIPRYFLLGVPLGLMVPIAVASRRFPRSCASLLLGGLGWLVFVMPTMPIASIPPVPAVYERLAALPPGVLLELPAGMVESKVTPFGAYGAGIGAGAMMYLQVLHQHPRTAGFSSRIPLQTYRAFVEAPVMGELLTRTSEDHEWRQWREWNDPRGAEPFRVVTRLMEYDPVTVPAFLRTFAVRYVIVDSSLDTTLLAEVEALLGPWVLRKETFQSTTLLVLGDPAQGVSELGAL